MRIRLTLGGVALSLASFAFATTPVIASGQQQNQNSAAASGREHNRQQRDDRLVHAGPVQQHRQVWNRSERPDANRTGALGFDDPPGDDQQPATEHSLLFRSDLLANAGTESQRSSDQHRSIPNAQPGTAGNDDHSTIARESPKKAAALGGLFIVLDYWSPRTGEPRA